MHIKDLIPWNRNKPTLARNDEADNSPLLRLQRDINRVFDEFWSRFDHPVSGSNWFLQAGAPRADVSETDEEVEIAVELPGLDENDIEVSLTDDIVSVRGEKKVEREEKQRGYYLAERSHGSFHRMIPLPPGVDTDKAKARFKHGVLTIRLPRTPESRAKVKRIEIKNA